MQGTLLSLTGKISHVELAQIPTPPGTATHRPVPHAEIVAALIETLSFRQVAVVRDEYAVSGNSMRMFGVLDLETGMTGVRFSIGVRNANDKSMRLAMTVGYRVLVCDNMAFHGDFTPVLAKHTRRLSLADALSIDVDRMQRNFEPMRMQIEAWRASQLADDQTKLVIYRAFIESELAVPKHLARVVHDRYFHLTHEDFAPRTIWSLSNAFTAAFKELEHIPQFRATAKLGPFRETVGGETWNTK